MSRLFYLGLVLLICSSVYGGEDGSDDEPDGAVGDWADSEDAVLNDDDESVAQTFQATTSTTDESGGQKCGENERVDGCPTFCSSNRCPTSEEESKRSQFCPQPKSCPTKPGCTCIFNHRRDRKGKCIPTTSCPPFKCSGINEEYNPCPPMCPTDDCSQASPTGTCPAIGRIGIVLICNPACRCKKNYWRKNGICVPYAECSGDSEPAPSPVNVVDQPIAPARLICGINEELRCVNSCPPQRTCKNRNIQFACLAVVEECKDTCVCKPGYFRNYLGDCITGEQCDKCSKPNEFYSCGGACDNECKNIKTQSRTNCPIQNIVCNKKCYCEDGYARDAKGNCVPVDQCSPAKKCGRNEVERCVKACPAERTCRRPVVNYICVKDTRPCKTKCVCADGYLRNSIGECITAKQCAKCSKPNEFFSCGSPCDTECKSYPFQSRTNCLLRGFKCTERCYCDDGYARDDKGNCVPVANCKPKPLACGVNEEEICTSGCPPPKTCENRNVAYACPADVPCKRTCECKPDYYRNAIGECISYDRCEQCSKPNEFFSCGTECDNECNTHPYQNRTNCPIKNKKCAEKCYCIDGYARDIKGNCIPVNKCRPRCRDPNEEYVLTKTCPPDQCISLVARFNCDQTEVAQYRCRCKSGYFRVKAGSPCVPICQCPQLANSPDCVDNEEEEEEECS